MNGEQTQFNFDAPSSHDGYQVWVRERRGQLRRLARELGLPLQRRVEVWLRNNIRLRGILELADEPLILSEEKRATVLLKVDGVSFHSSEIESWVRLDD